MRVEATPSPPTAHAAMGAMSVSEPRTCMPLACGLWRRELPNHVQGGLFGRQPSICPVGPNEVWISPRVRAPGARHEVMDLRLGTTVAPFGIPLLLVGVRLFLGKPLRQG